MDEYKPINVHGILLTVVHDGGTGTVEKTHRDTGEEYKYFPNKSLLLPTKHSNSVTLKNWTAVAHSQQPAQQR